MLASYNTNLIQLLCLTLLLCLALGKPSYSAFISLFIFMIIAADHFKRHASYFLIVSPLLFLWLSELVSGAFIEAGAFMDETDRIGYQTGGFSRLTFIYALCLYIGTLFIRDVRKIHRERERGNISSSSIVKMILILTLLVHIAVLMFGVVKGFPLLNGLDRFRFRADLGSDLFTSFMSNRLIIFGVLGCIYSSGHFRRGALANAMLLFIISALFGEKFTSLGLGAILFALPIGIKKLTSSGKLPLFWISLGTLVVGGLMIPLILLNYGFQSNSDAAVQRFTSRMAVQGQLWFLTEANYGTFINFDHDSLTAAAVSLVDLNKQTSQSASFEHGMYYVMAPFLSSRKLDYIIDDNGGFVFAHMSYWLRTTGYAGMAFIALLTFLQFIFTMQRFLAAGGYQDYISVIIWLKIIIWLISGYIMGNIWFFFGAKTIALMVAGVMWDRMSRKQRTRRIAPHELARPAR